MGVDAVVLGGQDLARLEGSRFAGVTQLAQTTSTNTVAVDLARAGEAEGLVVVADHQTAGRGRFDRRWESPPGSSLLVSVLLRPPPAELPSERRHLAVAAVSLAVTDAARVAAGLELRLKWPNDVIALGHGPGGVAKVAGVLAEGGPGWAVVGVGVNVSWAPASLAATSLETLAGRPVRRADVLVELLLALDLLYGDWARVDHLYRERCATIGRAVTVERPGQPLLSGEAVDVDGQGRLVVGTGREGLEHVAYGDVTHASLGGPSSLPRR